MAHSLEEWNKRFVYNKNLLSFTMKRINEDHKISGFEFENIKHFINNIDSQCTINKHYITDYDYIISKVMELYKNNDIIRRSNKIL